MAYKHLNCEERYYIEVERRRGLSANKIAKSLNRSQSCVSRELQRNTGEKVIGLNKQTIKLRIDMLTNQRRLN